MVFGTSNLNAMQTKKHLEPDGEARNQKSRPPNAELASLTLSCLTNVTTRLQIKAIAAKHMFVMFQIK